MSQIKNSGIEQNIEINNLQNKDISNIDIQLRRYTTILGYLQYENTAYWTRSQLFLVANAALFGLFANNIPLNAGVSVSFSRIYTLLVPAISGFILSLLWWKTLKVANNWILYWTRILLLLEPEAFGDLEVFRSSPKKEKRVPIKNIALWTVGLFIILWLLSIIYLLFISLLKIEGWDTY